MLQNSTLRKLFGIAGSFLIALNSFAWGPFIKAKSLHDKYFPDLKAGYKDPLLPYIHQEERQVSREQLLELLNHLSGSQRADLWKALKGKDATKYVSSEMLEKELLWMSSHWATYPFKKKQVNYHETVKWVAREIGVHQAECDAATTFQLERRIMEKLFAKMWDKLTPEQRKKILEESGFAPSQAAGKAVLGGAALLTALTTGPVIWGFPFYILMAKTVVVVVTALGGTAAGTIGTIAMLCGPIGWCIAAGCAAIGAALLGGPNVANTAGFICAIHSIKATALIKSKIDVSQYILK